MHIPHGQARDAAASSCKKEGERSTTGGCGRVSSRTPSKAAAGSRAPIRSGRANSVISWPTASHAARRDSASRPVTAGLAIRRRSTMCVTRQMRARPPADPASAWPLHGGGVAPGRRKPDVHIEQLHRRRRPTLRTASSSASACAMSSARRSTRRPFLLPNSGSVIRPRVAPGASWPTSAATALVISVLKDSSRDAARALALRNSSIGIRRLCA